MRDTSATAACARQHGSGPAEKWPGDHSDHSEHDPDQDDDGWQWEQEEEEEEDGDDSSASSVSSVDEEPDCERDGCLPVGMMDELIAMLQDPAARPCRQLQAQARSTPLPRGPPSCAGTAQWDRDGRWIGALPRCSDMSCLALGGCIAVACARGDVHNCGGGGGGSVAAPGGAAAEVSASPPKELTAWCVRMRQEVRKHVHKGVDAGPPSCRPTVRDAHELFARQWFNPYGWVQRSASIARHLDLATALCVMFHVPCAYADELERSVRRHLRIGVHAQNQCDKATPPPCGRQHVGTDIALATT